MVNHAFGHKTKCIDYTVMNIRAIHVRVNDDVSKLHKKVALGLYATRMITYNNCIFPKLTQVLHDGKEK